MRVERLHVRPGADDRFPLVVTEVAVEFHFLSRGRIEDPLDEGLARLEVGVLPEVARLRKPQRECLVGWQDDLLGRGVDVGQQDRLKIRHVSSFLLETLEKRIGLLKRDRLMKRIASQHAGGMFTGPQALGELER